MTASTDAAYDAAISYARTLGADHGASAAGWYVQDAFGGRSGRSAVDDRSAAQRILTGIEDGDPEVLDTLPRADLSGEWAGTLTGPALTAEALTAAGLVHAGDTESRPFGHAPGACEVCDSWDASGEIADAYESAYAESVEAAVSTAARAILA